MTGTKKSMLVLDIEVYMSDAKPSDLFVHHADEDGSKETSMRLDKDTITTDEDWSVLANQVVGEENF